MPFATNNAYPRLPMNKRYVPLVIASVLVTGCMAPINNTLNVSYVAPQGVEISRLAILPVTAGEGLEGFRRTTADSLYNALMRRSAEVEIVPAEESLRRLNEAQLAERYSNMMIAYDRTGILDRAVMAEMGRVLGTRHLLNLRVGYEESSRIGVGFATSVAETRTQAIHLFAHVWDTEVGDIVWEAAGGAASTSGEFSVAVPTQQVLAAATRNLAARLPIVP